jgi:hypothetical protein
MTTMTGRQYLACFYAAFVSAVPLAAADTDQPVARLSAADFVVDWPTYVGERVIIIGG